jgi:signal transduction histidine kinase
MPESTRVEVASKAFVLAAVLGMELALGHYDTLLVVQFVVVIAAVASFVSAATTASAHWVTAAEATLATLIVVATLPDSVLLLPYLVVLALLAGLARGVTGGAVVVVPHACAMVALTAPSLGLAHVNDRIELLAPWAVTIACAGLLGAWARKAGKSPVGTAAADANYDSARRLLGQLRNLARRLSSGLDPVTIASQMLVAAEEHTGPARSAVFTRTKGGLVTPLAFRGIGARELLDAEDDLIATAWEVPRPRSKPVVIGDSLVTQMLVMPLKLGSDVVGVVATQTVRDLPKAAESALQRDLDGVALRFATALAFDEVRNMVTADERQRLAREIHDGIAQEVASLGYVVDELAALSQDAEVTSGLRELRAQLSRVVTELRLSIFDLRTEVTDHTGLGSALSDYVRKVGAQSSMTVHLTLDEAPVRLSPGLESELLRIAQEAITNARKHSRAHNLWVDCWVQPPSALLRVRDDGDGITGARPDSYGLRIMEERAERINAHLTVEDAHAAFGRTGTCVTVSVGKDVPKPAGRVEAAS